MMGTRKSERCPASEQWPSEMGVSMSATVTFTCPICGQLARRTAQGWTAVHFLPLDARTA